MLGRYQGVIVLRDPDPRPEPAVPGNYYPRKVRAALVTLEQELAEIRSRHAARREYYRIVNAARKQRR